jgi:ribosomal protein S18 acetylase RimI-like enzyme
MPIDFKVLRGKPKEVVRLAALATSVFRPHSSPQNGLLQSFPNLFNDSNAHNLYYIEEHGKPVSLAGVVVSRAVVDGCSLTVGSVGAVCTLPDYRDNGMAKAILSRMFSDLETRQISMALISGDGPLYRGLDCTPAGEVLVATWDAAQDDERDRRFEARHIPSQARSSAARRILRLYLNEQYHFKRSLRFMRTALNAGRFRHDSYNQQLFEVLERDNPAAYVVAHVNDAAPADVTVLE